MLSTRFALGLLGALTLTSSIHAADAEAVKALPTIMTERGKLLFSDDFSGNAQNKGWQAAKGQWAVAEGSLKGTELKADNHPAATRHSLAFHNVIVQYSFKLDGAKITTFSINDPKGHNCRLSITSAGFGINKDSHDKGEADKAVRFGQLPYPIKAGEWYTMVLELSGKEMLAHIGDGAAVHGAHDSLDVDKSNFGLTVGGDSASFKDLRIWEALPRNDWDKSRVKAGK